MATQSRATRTREALITAAAADMDANGYDGSTLSAISASAKVSMGALTFHFSTKRALAEGVVREASAITRERTAGVSADHSSPLGAAIALLQCLADLLDESVIVRAAALLERERPEAVPGWHRAWVPALRRLLREADGAGELHQDARPVAAADLVVYLLTAVEVYRDSPVAEGLGAGSTLSRLLPFVWRGIVTEGV
ncbi:TetR/AcrR family transcriptional regulator (plasmid) [Streptomyces sp. NBC_01387]|uniref:TetR/AcrR family transcriptional regulator n=1 Tax=unclassified Streptomyces TaxID=2593676 RepID=UPI0022575B09|nr:TetR/AcrR family transcriptional regulator [Streptomyces sp. NBC_01500]MCX4554513.1 TetR/AcrR family transcriptional regulator [Streptomyces sp. NBC_01500]WSV59015.1 TetR/AcrR family transcriptional regulator [Streptomyces sp. NBC_01014]